MIEFNWINNCITLMRLFLLSKWSRKKIPASEKGNEIYILANGPSLNPELEEIGKSFFIGKDIAVVNHFVFSDLYQELKPKYYITSAPDFFLDNPQESIIETNERMFKGINEKTDWPMVLFVPFLAKKYKKWQSKINNPNVTIHYYNTTVAEGSFGLVKFMMNQQLGMPRVQNVLVPTLTFMIQKGYSNVYLFGVDHSWLKQIHVTEENDVLMSHPHFYEKEVKTMKVTKSVTETRKLHEVLYKFYHTFKCYFVLNRFAAQKGTKIYNLTKGSYVDAFERLTIEKLKKK